MTYQSYAPESASQRPDVVVLPGELFARRATIDRAVHWIDQAIRPAESRTPETLATVTDLATREVIAQTPPIDTPESPVSTVTQPSTEQGLSVDAARAQIDAIHAAGQSFTLTGAPEALDPAYLSNLNQAA